MDFLKVNSNSIKHNNAISSEILISNIIKDAAAIIKTSNNSIKKVSNSIAPYINNNLIINNKVSYKCIAKTAP
jgi:hypothetical protein